ncbi:calcium-binding protein [Labrys wisconsinensis]|uniref:Ca2+-binding RTX toxin-like protein n=1 Tax=Labrys wisconsinensis TaxID=425677 RepID=A0ABU0J7M9_9HYPH|nr:calcium-binding protein [Labrys wisconsinensis]MDQ0469453.1 Ca2+-binding RTX toxin-like protein [Labrys wisconsinensis]
MPDTTHQTFPDEPASTETPVLDLLGLLDWRKAEADESSTAWLRQVLDRALPVHGSAAAPATAVHWSSNVVDAPIADESHGPALWTAVDSEPAGSSSAATGDQALVASILTGLLGNGASDPGDGGNGPNDPGNVLGSGILGNHNVVWGTGGDDTLHGTTARETVLGLAGNDHIDGGGGGDTLIGGTGNDTYRVHAGDTVSELPGGGTDTVETDLHYYKLGANVENLTATTDTGQLLVGNQLGNTITGGAGNDVLNGGAGADTLIGGAGDDILKGGSGGIGLAGHGDWAAFLEQIGAHPGNGGSRVDRLWSAFSAVLGEAGGDTFVFKAGFGHDTITDFTATGSGHDIMQFDTNVFADFAAVLDAAHQVGTDTVITLDAGNSIVLKNVALTNLSQDDFKFIGS